jgi:hypothetical protein
MKAADFRRTALSLEGAEEGSHMGAVDFRVGGRIFATLASQKQGYGNLMLTPEQQAEFVRELPEVFLPIPGGWGKMGMTHIRLAQANEDVLAGALRAAWRIRKEKNTKPDRKKSAPRRGQSLRNIQSHIAEVRGQIAEVKTYHHTRPITTEGTGVHGEFEITGSKKK